MPLHGETNGSRACIIADDIMKITRLSSPQDGGATSPAVSVDYVILHTECTSPPLKRPTLMGRWGEFMYSSNGVVQVSVRGQHYLAPPHLGIWLPPGGEHQISDASPAVCHSVFICEAYCKDMPRRICTLTSTSLVRAILEHLRNSALTTCDPEARLRLLRVLVDQLSNCSAMDSYLPQSTDAELELILESLRKVPADNRSLDQLAAEFGISERTLIRRAKFELGISLTEWRQRLKLIHALPMLQSGQSVESVATECGFTTASAFIAMVRRLTGKSAGRYLSSDSLAQGPSSHTDQ